MSGRVLNFSAGPAVVPESCLRQAASEMLNWHGTGMSVIEVSHRGKAWIDEQHDATDRVRRLLKVPDNFKVMFVAGGASLQFSAIPLNILGDHKRVDFLITGHWSRRAMAECKRLFPDIDCHVSTKNADVNPTGVPDPSTWDCSPDAAYCYYCDNETIQGIEFPEPPEVPSPLVIDMSSNLFSKEIKHWERVGIIFSCSQKLFGAPGISIVIIRDDLLQRKAHPLCPVTLNYNVQLAADQMYNTPPTFGIYFANLIMKWFESEGGIEEMERRNIEKARRMYAAIDRSPHFINIVEPAWRSRMNAPFCRKDGLDTKDDAKDQKFLDAAAKQNMVNIKGHITVGNFRATMYNAVSLDQIDHLIKFMDEWPGF